MQLIVLVLFYYKLYSILNIVILSIIGRLKIFEDRS